MDSTNPQPVSEVLIGRVERFTRSYFISEDNPRPGERRVGDEASLTIKARISHISKRHRAHLGAVIEMTLACARTYAKDERPDGDPFLLLVNLKRGNLSLMAYLPAEPFWAMPALLADAHHFCARFDRTQYGSGTLTSLYFSGFDEILDHGGTETLCTLAGDGALGDIQR